MTPDRALARRVAAHCARWEIAVDDSAGQPLAMLPPGTLLLALAEAASQGFAPLPLLGLLKHPLAMPEERLGWLEGVRALDLALRGPRPAPGLAGIDRHLAEQDGRDGARAARGPALVAAGADAAGAARGSLRAGTAAGRRSAGRAARCRVGAWRRRSMEPRRGPRRRRPARRPRTRSRARAAAGRAREYRAAATHADGRRRRPPAAGRASAAGDSRADRGAAAIGRSDDPRRAQ